MNYIPHRHSYAFFLSAAVLSFIFSLPTMRFNSFFIRVSRKTRFYHSVFYHENTLHHYPQSTSEAD